MRRKTLSSKVAGKLSESRWMVFVGRSWCEPVRAILRITGLEQRKRILDAPYRACTGSNFFPAQAVIVMK